MTIRARLTIWYAGILFISVLVISSLSLNEFARERRLARMSHGEIEENDAPEDVIQITVICGIPAAIIGLAGGWWLMRKAMSPVTALTDAASRINESTLKKQLPRTGNGDELDRLTEVFNDMIARLDTSFNRIREFTLHASHELKTPLTVIHSELETALNNPHLSPENRESLLSQLDEVQRLTKIVDGLSLLTKADAGQIILKRDPVRLDELVRDCVADAQILAQPNRIKVELTRCDRTAIMGDRHRLRQLLLNLTDNAVKYNQPNGTLSVELARVEQFAELKISNTGPGIPSEMLSRVFERFFRCDTSHGTTVDGCGLGLSIAQWIVTAHEGTIAIESKPAEWTTVQMRFPVATT